MEFPADPSAYQWLAGRQPRASIKADTKVQRTNQEGQPLYEVSVIAGEQDRDPVTLRVRTPVEPKGLVFGTPVRFVGFKVSPWSSRSGDSGVIYYAERIEHLRAEKVAS